MKPFGNAYDAGRMARFRVGEWTVDSSDGTIASADRRARLEPKVMAVLELLAGRRGTLVSHDVLLREVWRGTHVAPGALTRTISLLRRALGDDVRRPRYVETVPKRGYRLIAPVDDVVESSPAVAALPPVPQRAIGSHALHYVILAAAVAALAVMGSPERVNAPPMADDQAIVAPQVTHHTRVGNENAFAHYTRAVAMHPASADAHAGLATVYVFRANYLPDRARWAAAAIDQATRAASLDAQHAGAVQALGMAHAQAGRFGEAAAYFTRALDLCPLHDVTRANLARVLLLSGRVADALVLIEPLVAAAPDNVMGYAHLGQAFSIGGQDEAADHAARAALVLEPYALEPQMVLARSDLLAARYGAARGRLERLL
jgi:DNA-binding winged helix-turn-helix (wHTH) protein/Tfp pilus assembly protein PilF